MKRTKLKERILPDYTKGEEIFNYVSHIAGAAFGVAYLVLCVIKAALNSDIYGIIASAIYGGSVVILFTVSSVYHALNISTGKKVMQVLDHCVIYLMIAGTYTPITLCALRRQSPLACWIIFGIVWGLSAFSATLNAIDLKKYRVFSVISYLLIGWCVIFTVKPVIAQIGLSGFLWLLGGGILYSIGAALYVLGQKKRWLHSVFHIFIVLGSLLQFFAIYFYVL